MKTTIILELEQDIRRYGKVLVFLPNCNPLFVKNFCESDILANTENVRIYMSETSYSGVKENVRIISLVEIEEILKLYHMYEFSNRLQIIGKNKQYGSLLNYLDTGILTETEVFEAILN